MYYLSGFHNEVSFPTKRKQRKKRSFIAPDQDRTGDLRISQLSWIIVYYETLKERKDQMEFWVA